jgi:hypothetical protein
MHDTALGAFGYRRMYPTRPPFWVLIALALITADAGTRINRPVTHPAKVHVNP